MPATSTERALTLLSLLSSRATWLGSELAEQLGVTDRTVRRDVDRLRTLDFQVDSIGGTGGGYRLRAGANMPPLFFDEDETIAVVTALLVAIGNQTTGMVDGSTRALGKLHHLLPARYIHKLSALQHAAAAAPLHVAPPVDPKVVAALAEACRDRVIVRYDYRSRAGAGSSRRVEPVAIVTARSVWYLIGFDMDRNDWRLFRVDRMHDVVVTGHGTSGREVPDGDPMAFLARSLAATVYAYTADLTVAVEAAQLHRELPWLNVARVESTGHHACSVHLGSNSVDDLVIEILRVVAAVDVRAVAGSTPVLERLSELGTQLTQMPTTTGTSVVDR